MFTFKFTGSIREFNAIVDALPPELRESLIITVEGGVTKVFNLDERAAEAAKPHIAQGNKIAGIRAIREVTGWTLKEAKDFIEKLHHEGVTP